MKVLFYLSYGSKHRDARYAACCASVARKPETRKRAASKSSSNHLKLRMLLPFEGELFQRSACAMPSQDAMDSPHYYVPDFGAASFAFGTSIV
jgi:hypothetical protein